MLGISGSLRRGSHNTRLLRAAARLLPPGAALELLEIRDVPPYDQDLDGERPPRAVHRLRDSIAAADAVVIATPEYNASIPGVLKNAIDWASRPFPGNALSDKPVLVIGATTGIFGAVWAQAELRKVLDHLGARVSESELAVGSADRAFTDDGRLRDPALGERLAAQLGSLAGVAQLEPTAA